MATWFATAAGNINTAGRWNSAPDGSGTTLTWPPASGDILVCNGRNITVNVSATVAECRNDTTGGATAGGFFQPSNGVTLTANTYTGTVGQCVFFNAAAGFLVGNVYAGSGNSSYGVNVQGTGTLNITGNVYGGTNTNCAGVLSSAGAPTINIAGDVFGGTGTNSRGAQVFVPGSTINITGNAIAGSGSGASGIENSQSTSTVTVTGYVQASTVNAGANNAAQGIVSIGETRSASNGRPAVTGAFRYASATAAKSLPIVAGTQKTLAVLDVAALVPDAGDVRSTVVYGDGAYTGTLPVNRKRLSMAGRF
jgi:hypothetical protein